MAKNTTGHTATGPGPAPGESNARASRVPADARSPVKPADVEPAPATEGEPAADAQTAAPARPRTRKPTTRTIKAGKHRK